jgi:hypothetical protein
MVDIVQVAAFAWMQLDGSTAKKLGKLVLESCP